MKRPTPRLASRPTLLLRFVGGLAWIKSDQHQHRLLPAPRLNARLRRLGNRAYALLYRGDIGGDRLFEFVQIQTITGCNLSCACCPANKSDALYGGLGGRDPHLMSPETFARITRELKEIDYAGAIQLFLMNEPTLDPLLAERVAALRVACPRARLRISSNGVAATEELVNALFAAGLDELVVDDYLRGKIAARFAAMRIDSRGGTLRVVSREGAAVPDPLGHGIYNRAGNAPGASSEPLPASRFCDRPSRFLYLNWQGRALLCCSDWTFEEVVGDVREQGLMEIWRGEPLRSIRRMLAEGERDQGICARCDFGGAQPFWEGWPAGRIHP